MVEWKDLPDALNDQERRFAGELRRLKDDSGLSLTTLAERTTFSRSSWDRYLNGRSLPSVAAVRELARLCGENADRLLALRTLAEPGRRGGRTKREAPGARDGNADGDAGDEPAPPAVPDAVSTEPAAPVRPPRSRRTAAVLAVAAAAAVTTGGLSLVVVPLMGASEPRTADSRQVKRAPFTFEPGRIRPCDIHREAGLLHAGHSDTVDGVLQQISTSWEVVEAQCLLQYRGYSPGQVDGAYGQSTEKAVKRLQDEAGLVPDGIVGPHTWEVLRR